MRSGQSSSSIDFVTAKTWLSGKAGTNGACQPFTSDQLDTVFTQQVMKNVIIPSNLQESLYYGPVCDENGRFQVAFFSDKACNVYIPGMAYLLSVKLTYGVGINEGRMKPIKTATTQSECCPSHRL
jgi:hypothetical protein